MLLSVPHAAPAARSWSHGRATLPSSMQLHWQVRPPARQHTTHGPCSVTLHQYTLHDDSISPSGVLGCLVALLTCFLCCCGLLHGPRTERQHRCCAMWCANCASQPTDITDHLLRSRMVHATPGLGHEFATSGTLSCLPIFLVVVSLWQPCRCLLRKSQQSGQCRVGPVVIAAVVGLSLRMCRPEMKCSSGST